MNRIHLLYCSSFSFQTLLDKKFCFCSWGYTWHEEHRGPRGDRWESCRSFFVLDLYSPGKLNCDLSEPMRPQRESPCGQMPISHGDETLALQIPHLKRRAPCIRGPRESWLHFWQRVLHSAPCLWSKPFSNPSRGSGLAVKTNIQNSVYLLSPASISTLVFGKRK